MAIIDFYVPNDWKTAGDSLADNTKMVAPYNTGLLHLINYLMHTEAGRTFMHGLIPGQNGHTAATIRPLLLAKYATFNVGGAQAEALVGAHLAGFDWIAVRNDPNPALRAEQELIYKQHLAAVSWFLWEEGQGPMFSLGW